MNEFDQVIVNSRHNEDHILSISPSRRTFLSTSVGLLGLFSVPSDLLAQSKKAVAWGGLTKAFTFESVPLSQSRDNISLPMGYRWSVVAAWGDPINGKFPHISYDVNESAQKQAMQFGMHHDGCAFFEDANSKTKGLWVVNHEYTDDGLLHPEGMRVWGKEQVTKSQAAHGVTVAHIQKSSTGMWEVVDGPYARRVTGYSPCRVSGPAAGHALMKTAADPQGQLILGTLNNCANGVTPWGTYLTCEENINGYFVKTGAPTKEEARIGINNKGFGYRWQEFDERFNVDKTPNEPNRFGWVVEIDPRNPHAAPTKRTALGRFKHEGAEVTIAKDGRVVVYMGDDQAGEYVYRYVSKKKYLPGNAEHNAQLLDDGTLFVAQFGKEGSGTWVALVHGQDGLTKENGFEDQAYILINARLAADFVKATPMDRAEWVTVHPKTKEVYIALTNNALRGDRFPVDDANPRAKNSFGHIVRWRPQDFDAASKNFYWEIFTLAGDPKSAQENLQGNIRGDLFGSPDGLWFDQRGILWTQTDISTSALGKGPYAGITNNMMFAADPVTKEFRRFLIGPNGCEITGVDMTSDYKTMFINIQHPGETASERSDPKIPKVVSTWPDQEKFSRPRSATIAIWREDGKPVGA